MKAKLLKAKMVEKGVNVESLADNIGASRSALYRKLNNIEKITIGDAIKIKAALDITDEDACKIFLA